MCIKPGKQNHKLPRIISENAVRFDAAGIRKPGLSEIPQGGNICTPSEAALSAWPF